MAKTNICMIFWIIITFLIQICQFQFIKGRQYHFHSYSCTLGTTSSATSGNYTCTTYHDIYLVKKHSFCLASISKAAANEVQASVSISYPSSRTTQFILALTYIGTNSMFLSYFILAIDDWYRNNNDFIDMATVSLPDDASGVNNLRGGQNTVRSKIFTLTIATQTFFSTTTGLTLVPLISMTHLKTLSTSTKIQMIVTATIQTTTSFQVKIEVKNYVVCRSARIVVVIYHSANIARFLFFKDSFSFKVGGDTVFDYVVRYPDWGPRFNQKCFLGYSDITFMHGQDFDFKFTNTTKMNFYKMQNLGVNTAGTIFTGNSICFTSFAGLQCGETLSYEDWISDTCNLAPDCRIPDVQTTELPRAPQYCQACYDDYCSMCEDLDRHNCTQCQSGRGLSLVGGDCVCPVGYGMFSWISGSCSRNCSYLIPNCSLTSCSSQTFCTTCQTNFLLTPVSATVQGCEPCSLAMQNCITCSSPFMCTVCELTFYPQQSTSPTTCVACTIMPNCVLCTSNTTCTVCLPDFEPFLPGCRCNFSPIANCISCIIPGQCSLCAVNYYINTTTKLCNLCTNLFQCSDCTNQLYCTDCNPTFVSVPDGSNTTADCQLCSSQISNCMNCNSPTFCTLCGLGFGFNSTNQCQACSSLIPHCFLCFDYTACGLCEQNNITFAHLDYCLKCTDISNCLGCNYDGTEIICTQCQATHYLNSADSLCYLCQDQIDDCSQCFNNTLTNNLQCNLCTSLFLLDINYQCKICKQGTYVTRTCTDVTGCLSSHVINGVVTCLSCDASQHFQYNVLTEKCECQIGFSFNFITEKCDQICGDGLAILAECDDKNIISGDGCSNECKTQEKFQCSPNGQGVSACILNQDFSIFFDYILRNLGQNTASLYFTVTPASTFLQKIDWKKIVTFNFSETIKTEISYSNGILVITVEYTTDIEDKLLDLKIEFDSAIVNSDPSTFSIKMNALNGQLNYDKDSGSFRSFKMSGMTVGLVCLLAFLISSYFHKMIGLQTVQFIQLIYFVRMASQNVSQSSFYALNSLKYSNGYNDLTDNYQSRQTYKALPKSFIRLDLSLYFLDNCNLMLIPIGLASILFLVNLIKKAYLRYKFFETKQKIHKDNYTITSRNVDFYYDNFIFSFILSLLFVVFYSSLIYMFANRSIIPENGSFVALLSFSCNLTVLFYVSTIFCFETLSGINKFNAMKQKAKLTSTHQSMDHEQNTLKQGFHPLYISVYLLYQLLILCVMNLIFIEFSLLIETILLLSCLYLVMFLAWKPYKMKIHNYALIANQFTVIMFVSVQLLMKYKVLNRQIFSATIYVVLSMITIAIIFQTLRLYLQRKQNAQIDLAQSGQQTSKGKNKIKITESQTNPFLFNNQLNSMKQGQRQCIQENMFGKYEMKKHPQDLHPQDFKKLLLNKKKLTINTSAPLKPENMHANKVNELFEGQKVIMSLDDSMNDQLLLAQVKEKLRKQFNQLELDDGKNKFCPKSIKIG